MPYASTVTSRVRNVSTSSVRLISRRSRPPAVEITRLVVTAMAAYLAAELLLEVQAPLLAPLTALLVVQASSYQTMRHAFQRVLSVATGVLVAVALAALLGFTWWSLGLAIAASLVLGHVLKLNDHILEVPISAMLILQLGTEAAATDRIVETIIGAGVGLAAGLIASPVRVQPAAEAITELGASMSGLLDDIAGGLRAEPDEKTVGTWVERSKERARDIQRTEQALAAAEESARLNPRARNGASPGPALRLALETFEHAAVTTRGLTRSVADRTKLHTLDRSGLGKEMWEADVRDRLAATLRELAQATRRYCAAATSATEEEAVRQTGLLESSLDAGRRERDALGALLREDPGHWPLHGELLVHLDRLLDGMRDGREPLVHGVVRHRPVPPEPHYKARLRPARKGPGRPKDRPAATDRYARSHTTGRLP
ncbi:FUSC family protein [Actinocorallia longicatena]|uniref:Aromatic acid exporter family member 1 n=1 Tax=Actinocorallia longicatena TaxID=111803 RepID=A0ABP6QM30_9ACTN